MKLKEILKENCHFKHFTNGGLYYETDESKFVFEIPISELGNSYVLANEKASIFMKWISRTFKNIEKDIENENI